MATRSAIALRLPKGGFRVVYCHWDGYPSHHLPILTAHYPTAKATAALLRPGDISSLRTRQLWDCESALRDANGEHLTDSEGYLRYANDREPQPLYYHERGDSDVSPAVVADLEALSAWADGRGCEHVYLYVPFIGWHHLPLFVGPDGESYVQVMPGCDPSQY